MRVILNLCDEHVQQMIGWGKTAHQVVFMGQVLAEFSTYLMVLEDRRELMCCQVERQSPQGWLYLLAEPEVFALALKEECARVARLN